MLPVDFPGKTTNDISHYSIFPGRSLMESAVSILKNSLTTLILLMNFPCFIFCNFFDTNDQYYRWISPRNSPIARTLVVTFLGRLSCSICHCWFFLGNSLMTQTPLVIFLRIFFDGICHRCSKNSDNQSCWWHLSVNKCHR